MHSLVQILPALGIVKNAAELQGLSISDFIVAAAQAEAIRTIAGLQRLMPD